MALVGTTQWILIAFVGLTGGVLGGALGIGGGVFLVPALVYLLAAPQKTAQGMALLIMVPMALTSGIRYLNNPDIGINYKVLLLLIIMAIIGALIGTNIAFALPGAVLRKAFAVLIIGVGILMLWK